MKLSSGDLVWWRQRSPRIAVKLLHRFVDSTSVAHWQVEIVGPIPNLVQYRVGERRSVGEWSLEKLSTLEALALQAL